MKKKLCVLISVISVIAVFVICFLAKKGKHSNVFENRFGLNWVRIGNKWWSFPHDEEILGI